ncbi:MAG: hypothetical protein ACK5DJ_01690, partial [Bacteroidota bacterium]
MSIKNLYEISSLVTKRQNANQLFIADNEEFEVSLKYKRLIEGITQEKWKTDEDAKVDLYGGNSGTKTFEMLKSRAKDRLVSLIFQSDANKLFENPIEKALFSASRSYLTGLMLFNRMKLSSGQEQLKLSLKIAREFQFYDLQILILRQLRKYSSFSGNEKSFLKYSKEMIEVQKCLNAEIEAEGLDLEVQTPLVNSVHISDSWIESLRKNLERVSVLSQNYNSFQIKVYFYKLSVRLHQANDDYRKAIGMIEQYQMFLKSNPKFNVRARNANAAVNKLYCALFMKDYQLG